MRKRNLVLLLAVCLAVFLSACGSISDKVKQVVFQLEVGAPFDVTTAFECKDDVSVAVKQGNYIDTSKVGEASAQFILSNGKAEEEKAFTFQIVDTQSPIIKAENASAYVGTDFDFTKYVSCQDNSGKEIKATVKSGNIDLQQRAHIILSWKPKTVPKMLPAKRCVSRFYLLILRKLLWI